MTERSTHKCYTLGARVTMADFEDLVGKTLVRIEGMEPDSDRVDLTCDDGSRFAMYHRQDCCESVYLADVVGDLDGLLGLPILVADEASQDASEIGVEEDGYTYLPESATWTFYTIRTVRTTVTLRWYGSSNGYYSESVDFVRMAKED